LYLLTKSTHHKYKKTVQLAIVFSEVYMLFRLEFVYFDQTVIITTLGFISTTFYLSSQVVAYVSGYDLFSVYPYL